MKPEIALVVAVAKNNVIGAAGGLPWRLSTDLKRFKALTVGKPVVMGRLTFESIGKALPDRPNIVVTRSTRFSADGVEVARTVRAAIDLAKGMARDRDAQEICVIGGGQIFEETLGIADRLYVTHVEAAPAGDTLFPPIDRAVWKSVHCESIPAGDRDSYSTRFVVYERETDAA